MAGMLFESGLVLPLAQARNYGQALDIMALHSPRIAVLDINLPGKNGLELLQAIKAIDKNVTVVMLTNQAGDYYRKMARDLGADYFLDKSNDFERLPDLLHEIVNS